MATDSLSLKDLLYQTVQQHGALEAVVVPGAASFSVTHEELFALAEGVARLLASLPAQSVVALVAPNGLAFVAAFLGITYSRAIAAPLNAAYTEEEFGFFLRDAGAALVVLDASLPGSHPGRLAAASLSLPIWTLNTDPAARTVSLCTGEGAPVASGDTVLAGPTSDDVALFLHTSGTTSRPKGVPLSHANLVASTLNIADTYHLLHTDRSYIVMPLFHVHGLIGATLSTLQRGGAVVIPDRFSATSFWGDVERHGVTWYSAVPTIHQILLLRADADKAPARSSLRFIRSCSSALAPVTLAQLEERFGVPVLEAYGMTEAAHQMASNPLPSDGERRPGTVGRGTNVLIAILDNADDTPLPDGTVGEVCIRGRNVTHGYHNNEQANRDNFTASGWFRTGDQGVLQDGYLTLTGRLKELINRGGEKISPLELDAVLLEHPSVAEGVAFPAPDAKYGEIVCVAVVPKEGMTLTADDVIEFMKPRVAAFKVPSRVFIASSLPRTATGKIQRRHVAAHFLAQ